MEELIKAVEELTKDRVIKAVISNTMNNEVAFRKVVFELKENKNKTYYQIEKFTEKQVFHENIDQEDVSNKLMEYLGVTHKQAAIWSDTFTYDIKLSKKGKPMFSKKRSDNSKIINTTHNKEKNYILKEGLLIQPLIDLGVFTKEGKIVNSKYDKYKQINRFVEMIDDEIKNENYSELTVIDFGCGKSYLSFVLYYYFAEIKKINIKMIGLDLKADVIKNCNDIAKKYQYDNLHFELGDVNGYKYEGNVDMVITLHACDTATDYALYNAIKWNSKMIFSVPCCQHELNSQIESNSLSILTRYGIVKERVSALMTDSIRANLLESVGYKTQLLEFIDISHSPKNILIRAIKGSSSNDKKSQALKEVVDLNSEFNLKPTLYNLLKEDNII